MDIDQILNARSQSSEASAKEICELIDFMGFTSEIPFEPSELQRMISDILDKHTNPTPVVVEGDGGNIQIFTGLPPIISEYTVPDFPKNTKIKWQ